MMPEAKGQPAGSAVASSLQVYETLTLAHFDEWKHPVDLDPAGMTGFAARRDGELVAIACFYCDGDRWFAAFRRTDRCAPAVHKMTLKALDALRQAKVTELWAYLDETRPRARVWLERLGFEPVNGTEWRLRIGVSRTSHGRDRNRDNDLRDVRIREGQS